MPKHRVEMRLPQGIVINTDVELQVWSGGEKLGELHLSKGSIDWRPAGARTSERSLRWERFADLMTEHGRVVRRTPRKRA